MYNIIPRHILSNPINNSPPDVNRYHASTKSEFCYVNFEKYLIEFRRNVGYGDASHCWEAMFHHRSVMCTGAYYINKFTNKYQTFHDYSQSFMKFLFSKILETLGTFENPWILCSKEQNLVLKILRYFVAKNKISINEMVRYCYWKCWWYQGFLGQN